MAALLSLTRRYFSSPGERATLPSSLSSVAMHVVKASPSRCACRMARSFSRSSTSRLAGLTGTNAARRRSSASAFKRSSSASLAFSSAVSSAGSPSLARRSARSCAILARIFSRAAASSSLARWRSIRLRRRSASSSSPRALFISLALSRIAIPRALACSFSSFSRRFFASARILAACSFASSGVSFGLLALASLASASALRILGGGSSISASSECSTSQLTAPSTVVVPLSARARYARARGNPIPSISTRCSPLTGGSTISASASASPLPLTPASPCVCCSVLSSCC
mmetsp:Transcript_7471/g.22736  ORF Transcript_7471/g.22736 Transcript_7471/m.22736 type:complete len:288 (+) Transcript_7471:542-1405(+)